MSARLRGERPLAGAGTGAHPPAKPGPRGPWIALALAAAACIVVTVSFRIYDPDLWQHLAAGRLLWQTHRFPHAEIWTWPTYGAPSFVPSWGFAVLLWPFFERGGVAGLFAWRWLTTLAAFGLLWATARRMGARGVVPIAMLVIASLVWRQRSMARPETLAAVLLGIELLILETRRNGGRDRSAWLLLVLWLWVQAHVSFVLGFAVLAIYLADEVLRARRAVRRGGGAEPRATGPARLAFIFAGAAALVFVNPFFTMPVWQPLDFFLHQRHEPLFRTIDELQPVDWRMNARNALPLLVLGWPVLALWRLARGRADPAELMLCALFTWIGLGSQRFLGFYALVAAPFVSRDLEAWWAGRDRAARPLAWGTALLFAVILAAICVPEWTRPEPKLGVALDVRSFPVAACDFMAAHGVRGRGFNYFYHGGYLLWRFGLERDRLPFMDIHQAGTPEIRRAYLAAFGDRTAWLALDRTYRFDWLLLRGQPAAGDSILDFADDDPVFAPVFLDDAAALYVRREGSLAAVADSFAFVRVPGGTARLDALGEACGRDPPIRAATRRELERALADSPRHARAASLLANVALIEGRYAEARRLLLEAQSVAPETRRVSERLAMIAADSARRGSADALRNSTAARRDSAAALRQSAAARRDSDTALRHSAAARARR